MVHVAVAQDHGSERAVPARGLRLKPGRGQNLLAQIGSGIEEQPAFSVGAHRQA
jgi:hypothetical protein